MSVSVAELIASLELDVTKFTAGSRLAVDELQRIERAHARASAAFGTAAQSAAAAGRTWSAAQAQAVVAAGPAAAAADDVAAALRRWENSASTASARTGALAVSAGRGSQKISMLAMQVAALTGVSAGASGAVRALGTATQVAALSFAALGPVAAAAAAGLAGYQLGKLIGEFIELGDSAAGYAERLQKAATAEGEFGRARKALVAITTDYTQATLANNAAIAAAGQRGSGQGLRALETERKAALAALDVDEKRAHFKLVQAQNDARYDGDAVARARALAAHHLFFASARSRIDDDAARKRAQFQDERFAREREGDRALLDMSDARDQAERSAIVARLQAEGHTAAALLTMREDQILAVRVAADKEREAWRNQLEGREIDQAQYDARLVTQSGATSAKIAAIMQGTSLAWKNLMKSTTDSIPDPKIFQGLMTDLEAKRVALVAAQEKLRTASVTGLPAVPNAGIGRMDGGSLDKHFTGPGPSLDRFSTGGHGIIEQLAQIRAVDEAWLAAQQAQVAYNESLLAAQKQWDIVDLAGKSAETAKNVTTAFQNIGTGVANVTAEVIILEDELGSEFPTASQRTIAVVNLLGGAMAGLRDRTREATDAFREFDAAAEIE